MLDQTLETAGNLSIPLAPVVATALGMKLILKVATTKNRRKPLIRTEEGLLLSGR